MGPTHRKRISISDSPSDFPLKKPKLCGSQATSVQLDTLGSTPQPAQHSPVSSVRGIERISLDKIPEDCRLDTGDVQRHRRDFLVREKQRLLSQGKLILPGKFKFLSDGVTFEWKSINLTHDSKPFSMTSNPKDETAVREGLLHVSSEYAPKAFVTLNSTKIQSSTCREPKASKTSNDPVSSIASTTIEADAFSDSDVEMDELDSSESGGSFQKPLPSTDEKPAPSIPSFDMAGSSLLNPIVLSDDAIGTSSSCPDMKISSGEEDEEVLPITPSRFRRYRRISSAPESSESSEEDGAASLRARKPSAVSRSSFRKDAVRTEGNSATLKKYPVAGRHSSIISVRPSSESDSRCVTLRETKHVPTPKNTYARGRRVLIQDKYIVTVSMRGDLQYFDVKTREREKALSNPWDPDKGKPHVEDACSVRGYGIIAYNKGPHQVSIVKNTKVVHLGSMPHEGGLSCLCPLGGSKAIKFFSGGHDHTVRLWTVSSDTYSAKVHLIPVAHSSLVHALAYTTKGQLVSASNCTALLFDVKEGKELMKGPSSNTICQVHVQPDQPNILATEVKHLDRQINIYDLREGFLNKTPAIDMGYREEGLRSGSRYQRGAFKGSLFVRGYHDGTIRLFDIRNRKDVVSTTLTRREHGAAHTTFWEGQTVLAFGGTMLSFLDFQYA